MNVRVCVVLSTFNGQRFLNQQIQSVLNQSLRDFSFFIRDDGSTDTSATIVKDWAQKDARIKVFSQVTQNLGTLASFSTLLTWAKDFQYVLLCDQDDIWLPHHIETLVARAQTAEQALGPNVPLLIHSDLTVISEAGTELKTSFRRALAAPFESLTLPELLAQNLVTGCSALANQALLATALPVPRNCLMHDWWLALVASATGQVIFVDQPLTLYRQHAAQVSGGLGASHLLQKLAKILKNPKHLFWLMERRWAQTVLLEHQLRTRGMIDQANSLHQLVLEFCQSRLSALSAALNFGIRPQGFLKTLVYYTVLVVCQPRIARILRPFQ